MCSYLTSFTDKMFQIRVLCYNLSVNITVVYESLSERYEFPRSLGQCKMENQYEIIVMRSLDINILFWNT